VNVGQAGLARNRELRRVRVQPDDLALAAHA
jgi:hypothetical protein